jgi:hypothetical protein
VPFGEAIGKPATPILSVATKMGQQGPRHVCRLSQVERSGQEGKSNVVTKYDDIEADKTKQQRDKTDRETE